MIATIEQDSTTCHMQSSVLISQFRSGSHGGVDYLSSVECNALFAPRSSRNELAFDSRVQDSSRQRFIGMVANTPWGIIQKEIV
jgi:hypothetical protein